MGEAQNTGRKENTVEEMRKSQNGWPRTALAFLSKLYIDWQLFQWPRDLISPATFGLSHVASDFAGCGYAFGEFSHTGVCVDGKDMPTFDAVVLFQKMEKLALKSVLKRTAEYIFEAGGTIRGLENLGFRETPYKISKSGQIHRECHYFVFNYDGSYEMREKLKQKFKLDRDVLRACTYELARDPYKLHFPKKKQECTLFEDQLPPPERPVIINIHDELKKKEEREKKREKFPLINIEDKQYLIF